VSVKLRSPLVGPWGSLKASGEGLGATRGRFIGDLRLWGREPGDLLPAAELQVAKATPLELTV
jgi:hypothetical protein